jgi:hypothetical protein
MLAATRLRRTRLRRQRYGRVSAVGKHATTVAHRGTSRGVVGHRECLRACRRRGATLPVCASEAKAGCSAQRVCLPHQRFVAPMSYSELDVTTEDPDILEHSIIES